MNDRPMVYVPTTFKTYKVVVNGVIYGTIYEKYRDEPIASVKERALNLHNIKECNLVKMRTR